MSELVVMEIYIFLHDETFTRGQLQALIHMQDDGPQNKPRTRGGRRVDRVAVPVWRLGGIVAFSRRLGGCVTFSRTH